MNFFNMQEKLKMKFSVLWPWQNYINMSMFCKCFLWLRNILSGIINSTLVFKQYVSYEYLWNMLSIQFYFLYLFKTVPSTSFHKIFNQILSFFLRKVWAVRILLCTEVNLPLWSDHFYSLSLGCFMYSSSC